MPITPLLEASSCKIDCGLKPSFAKPSVPDDDDSYFLTGVETPAQDKPSVPDETGVEETDLKLHDNVSTLFQPCINCQAKRGRRRHCILNRRILGLR